MYERFLFERGCYANCYVRNIVLQSRGDRFIKERHCVLSEE